MMEAKETKRVLWRVTVGGGGGGGRGYDHKWWPEWEKTAGSEVLQTAFQT